MEGGGEESIVGSSSVQITDCSSTGSVLQDESQKLPDGSANSSDLFATQGPESGAGDAGTSHAEVESSENAATAEEQNITCENVVTSGEMKQGPDEVMSSSDDPVVDQQLTTPSAAAPDSTDAFIEDVSVVSTGDMQFPTSNIPVTGSDNVNQVGTSSKQRTDSDGDLQVVPDEESVASTSTQEWSEEQIHHQQQTNNESQQVPSSSVSFQGGDVTYVMATESGELENQQTIVVTESLPLESISESVDTIILEPSSSQSGLQLITSSSDVAKTTRIVTAVKQETADILTANPKDEGGQAITICVSKPSDVVASQISTVSSQFDEEQTSDFGAISSSHLDGVSTSTNVSLNAAGKDPTEEATPLFVTAGSQEQYILMESEGIQSTSTADLQMPIKSGTPQPQMVVAEEPVMQVGFLEIPLRDIGGSDVLMISEDGTSVQAEVNGQLVSLPVFVNEAGEQVIHLQTNADSEDVRIEFEHPGSANQAQGEEVQILSSEPICSIPPLTSSGETTTYQEVQAPFSSNYETIATQIVPELPKISPPKGKPVLAKTVTPSQKILQSSPREKRVQTMPAYTTVSTYSAGSSRHLGGEDSSSGFPSEYIVPDTMPDQRQETIATENVPYAGFESDTPMEEPSPTRNQASSSIASTHQVVVAPSAGGNSFLTQENMNTLIQVLQSLPAAPKGQTIQILLQTSSQDDENDQTFTAEIIPDAGGGREMSEMEVTTTPTRTPMTGRGGRKVMCEMGVQTGDKKGRPSQRASAPKRRAKTATHSSSPPPGLGPDVKPGVSYYAVVDYLSEQEDGYQSGSDLKRPEAPIASFMEDHLELQCDQEDKSKFILESTVDSAIIISPFARRKFKIVTVTEPGSSIDLPPSGNQSMVTLQEKSLEQAMIEGSNLAEQSAHPIRGSKSSAYLSHSRLLNKVPKYGCGYCEFHHKHKIYVVQHCETDHAGLPLKTVNLLPRMGTRHCPFCKKTFEASEFFQHMRVAHSEVHPMKCGYCDFLGRDRNQVKHHIRKKHVGLKYKIINITTEAGRAEDAQPREPRKKLMATSDGDETVYEYVTDEEDEVGQSESEWKAGIHCPECKRPFKTLKYLKSHIRVHQRHRFQCGYCDFTSIVEHHVLKHSERKHKKMEPRIVSRDLEPDKNPLVSKNIESVLQMVAALAERLPKDPDETKWRRKWFCPHCDYTCQFGASYRRHLRMHANILPYKCNYCSFKGREKYYVRRHLQRMHPQLPAVVVDNTPENCVNDSSSDEDYQEKGLRRKRKRKVKRIVHPVIPLDQCMEMEMQITTDGSKKTWKRTPIPVHVAPTLEEDLLDFADGMRKAGRLPPAEGWSGDRITGVGEGGKITCKVCGQKTQEKAFYKHARKHFRVKPFKCKYCDYMSIERAKIRVHITLRHPNCEFEIEEKSIETMSAEEVITLMGAEVVDESTMLETVRFTCPVCQDSVAYEEEDIRAHFYAHFEYMPYQCGYCEYQDIYKQRIEAHADVHDRPVYIIDSGMPKPEGLDDMIKAFIEEGESLQHRMAGGIPQPITFSMIEVAPSTINLAPAPAVEKKTKAAGEKAMYQCPLCDKQMNCHIVTVRRHLFGHFEYKPFRCGYCEFQGGSTGEVKQHTVKHGSVKPEIVGTGQTMPDYLRKLLDNFNTHIQETKLAKKRENEPSEPGKPRSGEGARWMEQLGKGECPWCSENVGPETCYGHLRDHFNYKPYRCSSCDFMGHAKSEVKKHATAEHKNTKIKVLGPVQDTWEIEKGLRIYYQQKIEKSATTNYCHLCSG